MSSQKWKLFIFILFSILFKIQNVPIKMRNSNSQNKHSHYKQIQNFPEKIFGAQIHYSRIPHQYWEHRLKMIKAMGFNALSIYIMWNYHQIQKGQFDYENDDKNLIGFLQLARKEGFKIFFRPGPYICAQWDFGGLPARLLSIKDLEIRAHNKYFIEQVKIYFSSLVEIIQKNRDIILMLQIQNQYGFYGNDKRYMQAIRDIWKDLEINFLPQYYVDWFENIQVCHWQGANIGINNGIKAQEWKAVRKMQPNGYLIGGQIYGGWQTHWGQDWQGKSFQQFNNQFQFLMSNNHSFSMYMAHGGTTFGLYAGANGLQDKPYDYWGHVTSYDYDSAINEQGFATKKFYSFRQLAKKYATWQIPEIPRQIKTITINQFTPVAFADLFQNLPYPQFIDINQLIKFQDPRLKMWNQGFVAYETTLQIGIYEINLTIHDFALIYLNDEFLSVMDRGQKIQHTIQFKVNKRNSKLLILVEAMGHINFGAPMRSDYKGIISFKAKFQGQSPTTLIRVQLNKDKFINQKDQRKILNQSHFKWTIYDVAITNDMLNWKGLSSNKKKFPRLFRYQLQLQQTGDTYLNMERWKKGYVFVNGHNLGRYWSKGPQKKLFLPGVWLRKGVNDVVVLDLLLEKGRQIKGQTSLF